MLAEIVLPPGTVKITVREIPALFAVAIHPEPPDGTPPLQLLAIKKFPLTLETVAESCGHSGEPFGVSLTDDDWAKLASEAWKNLPPLGRPLPKLTEAQWEPYRVAALAAPLKYFQVEAEFISPEISQLHLYHVALKKYQELVIHAMHSGELTPRSPTHLAPVPDDYSYLDDCFVTIANLTKFAAKLDIGVRVADSAIKPKAAAPQATVLASKRASGGMEPEWKVKARRRAEEIIKRHSVKGLYPNQKDIADEIANEFRRDGVVGAGGKPLTGAYIKRHALRGITSAKGTTLSTAIRRGK
jgi:hypothetical protein